MGKFMQRLLVVIILVLLGTNLLQYCTHREDRLKQQQNQFRLEQSFQQRLDEAGRTVAVQRTMLLTQKEATQQGLREIEGLKKALSQVQLRTTATVRGVLAPYTAPIPRPKNTFSDSFTNKPLAPKDSTAENDLIPPSPPFFQEPGPQTDPMRVAIRVSTGVRPFSLHDPYYDLAGEVREEGVWIDSLQFRSSPVITIGYEKPTLRNFLKPAALVTDFRDENPYVRVSDMRSIQIRQEKKFYQRGAFWLTTGTVLGFIGRGVLDLKR